MTTNRRNSGSTDLLLGLAKDMDNDIHLIRSGRLPRDRAAAIASHAGKVISAINGRTAIARLRKEKPVVPLTK